MIKAIFFDIDGTLLPSHAQDLPQSVEEDLWKLHAKGIRLFLCTGRSPSSIRKLPASIVRFPWSGIIAANGQLSLDENGHIFHRILLSHNALTKAVSILKQQHIYAIFFEEDFTYASMRNKEAESVYHGFRNPLPLPVCDPCRVFSHETFQISLFMPSTMDEIFLNQVPDMKCARWSPFFADMIPSCGGKKKGIQVMLERYGIRREETMSFGDGWNDMEMLEYTAIGTAMKNAPEEVRNCADHVTDCAEKDGLHHAFVHFSLLNPKKDQ